MKRKLTRGEVLEQRIGATYIAPGIWRDRNGGIHYSVPELLEIVELPDTPENRAAVAALVRRTLEAQGASLVILQEEGGTEH